MHYIDSLGTFTGSETDAQGNIYVIGYCNVGSWYHFNNGDSLRIAITNNDTSALSFSFSSDNGFLVKLDSNGHYLWHAVFDDHSSYAQGYPVQGGLPNRIIVKNGEIFITGSFLANLSYVRNDISQRMYTLTNSVYARDNPNRFLVKINPTGSLAWKSYGHYTTTNSTEPADIAAGLNGDIMMVSDFENSVKFYDNDSTLIVNETGVVANNRSFLIRMNSTGHMVWKAKIEHQSGGNFQTQFSHIVTDNTGSAYITGDIDIFSMLVPLQVTNGDGSISISDTLSGFAILKFDINGRYRWSVGSKTAYYGWGKALVYKAGQLYAAGNVSNNGQNLSNFTFTSTNGVNYTGNFFQTELFIVNYDTAGVLKKVAKSGDNGYGQLEPHGLVLDSANNYIITGITDYTSDTTNVVFNQSFPVRGVDVFFAKISSDFCINCDIATWTGAVSSAWNNPQNWLCNVVPIASTPVTIPAGTNYSAIITSGQSFSVWSLDIQPAATMTVQAGATFNVLH